MPRYPHLTLEDSALWSDYLDQTHTPSTDYIYDFRVGKGTDPGPDFPDDLRKLGIQLSQRRIDALRVTPTQIHIFEITQSGGLKALGQLIAYPVLVKAEFPDNRPVIRHLVCRKLQPDIQPALDIYSVTVHEISIAKTA